MTRALIVLLLAALPACAAPPEGPVLPLGPPGRVVSVFPSAARPVAPVVSPRWTEEDGRERVGEAARVMDWMGVRPGMRVADVGAGSGYYTVRLAERVGPEGMVLAQDVTPRYLLALRQRVASLPNVRVGLGEEGDPRLPPASVDRALLVHMYHEVGQPFALLGNLAASMRPGGLVGIVDVDDAVPRHGTPLPLLRCELRAAGYEETAFHWLLEQPPRSEYLAVFRAPPGAAAPPATAARCGG